MRYEYECATCGTMIEYDLPVANRDEHVDEKCPCGGTMRRCIGNNGGFRLLGGRWASDGYSGIYGNTDEFKGKFGSMTDK